jgi:flagellar M-ring protein FliF
LSSPTAESINTLQGTPDNPKPSPQSATLVDTVRERVLALSFNQKILAAASALVLIAIVFATLLRGSGDYKVLFSNVADSDGAAIVAELAKLNVPYKFTEGGGAIMVPESRVYETRLKLAAQGLPRSGTVGFEVLENQKLGTSQFVERVNYQRALEGELSRSIASLAPVKAARVHLAIPRQTAFVREQERPTASVVIDLYPGAFLDTPQVAAVSRLVSSAVPGIQPQDVSVVDTAGNMLAPNASRQTGLDASQLKYAAEFESLLTRRVSAILEPIAGKGGYRAQVTVDLNFDERERTAETFGRNSPPNEQSIRSQQSLESGGRFSSSGGIPGALTNQPPLPPEAPIVNQVQSAERPDLRAPGAIETEIAYEPEPFRSERTVNYELDRSIERFKSGPGQVRRISAAVVLDLKSPSSNGLASAATLEERRAYTEDELAKIVDLVRDAVGFVEARGDTVTVANMPFSIEPQEEVSMFTPDLLSDLVKYAVIAAGLLFAYFALLRPLMNPKKPDVVAPALVEPNTELSAAEKSRLAIQEAEEAWELKRQEEESRERLRAKDAEIERSKLAAEEAANKERYQGLTSFVSSFAKNQPEDAALVLRNWAAEKAKGKA